MDAYDIAEIERQRQAAGELYQEFLRVPSMSVGLYVLEAGAEDPQSPHQQDEIYYVIVGPGDDHRGRPGSARASPGSVVFVAARVEHRFHSIDERLELLVLFAPGRDLIPPPGDLPAAALARTLVS